MIPRSPSVAIVSLGLAGALHAVIAVLPGSRPDVIATEGSGGASISALGHSFADMAKGAAVPEPEIAPPAETTETPLAPVTHTPPAETPTTAPAPDPVHSPAPDIVQSAEPPVEQADQAYAPTQAPAPDADRSPPPRMERSAALAPALDAIPPVPETVAPAEPAPAASPDPPDRIVAQPEPPAPQVSARPRARPERVEPERHQRAAQHQPGNSRQDARAGDASGLETARKQQAGTSRADAALSGNAAAASYPGQVMRHIQLARRERVNVRGAAQVSFTIAANGGLATVGIIRSSGSAQLDQVALQHIRRAAPFPPPPAGAQRSFTIRITGR